MNGVYIWELYKNKCMTFVQNREILDIFLKCIVYLTRLLIDNENHTVVDSAEYEKNELKTL